MKNQTEDVMQVTSVLLRLNPGFLALKQANNQIVRPNMHFGQLRHLFESALLDLGIEMTVTPEVAATLAEPQFRSLDSGRGPAVVAILGREVAEQMQAKAEEIARQYFYGGFSSSAPDRGVDQALADMLAIAVCEESVAEMAWFRLQRRIWKGYQRLVTHKKSQFPEGMVQYINSVFTDLEVPSSLLASCPAGGALEIWNALVAAKLTSAESEE